MQDLVRVLCQVCLEAVRDLSREYHDLIYIRYNEEGTHGSRSLLPVSRLEQVGIGVHLNGQASNGQEGNTEGFCAEGECVQDSEAWA